MGYSGFILISILAVCITTYPVNDDDSTLLQKKALDGTKLGLSWTSSELAPFPTISPEVEPTTTSGLTSTSSELAPFPTIPPEVQPTTTYAPQAPTAATTTYAQQAPAAATTTYYKTVVVTPTPTPPTQSCHATNHGLFNSYSVLIRVPFLGSTQCDITYNILESWIPISNWQCVQASGNYVQLWFNAVINKSGQINGALEQVYPHVVGGFNCPDH